MDTRTAATTADVTTATIRNWCRRNVIAAVKTAGKWTIDETSLRHRIALSATPAAITVTEDTWARALGVSGPADLLAAAFATNSQIAITAGHFAGEMVYVGRTPYVGAPRKGLDHADTDGTAVYVIDTDKLHDGAPRLMNAYYQAMTEGAAALIQADRDESAYLNPRYV